MKKMLIAYVPVLHKGYLKLFESCRGGTLWLLNQEVARDLGFDYIARKDFLRAIESDYMRDAISTFGIFKNVFVLSSKRMKYFNNLDLARTFVLPDEDISRAFVEKHLPGKKIEYQSIFLRWHRNNVEEKKEVSVDQTISVGEFERSIMESAIIEGQKSGDWWRCVGGILLKDGVVIMVSHNTHVPDPQMPYAFGDPRSIFKKGLNFGLSTADHAESVLIAEAARRGISLEGCKLFITDFPCPYCAKLIARSGIKQVFFRKGYAVLDGEDILKSKGIDLIKVDI
jgi:dCMP deaminase